MGRRELGGVSGRFLPARPTPEVCAQPETLTPVWGPHPPDHCGLPTGRAPDGTGAGFLAPRPPTRGPRRPPPEFEYPYQARSVTAAEALLLVMRPARTRPHLSLQQGELSDRIRLPATGARPLAPTSQSRL